MDSNYNSLLKREGLTKILIVSLFVAFSIEQTVALPQFNLTRLAEGNCRRLAVFYYQET
jgi:hypothetical protein